MASVASLSNSKTRQTRQICRLVAGSSETRAPKRLECRSVSNAEASRTAKRLERSASSRAPTHQRGHDEMKRDKMCVCLCNWHPPIKGVHTVPLARGDSWHHLMAKLNSRYFVRVAAAYRWLDIGGSISLLLSIYYIERLVCRERKRDAFIDCQHTRTAISRRRHFLHLEAQSFGQWPTGARGSLEARSLAIVRELNKVNIASVTFYAQLRTITRHSLARACVMLQNIQIYCSALIAVAVC